MHCRLNNWRIVGHVDLKTTVRYIHFMARPKQVLADKTARNLDRWLNGSQL